MKQIPKIALGLNGILRETYINFAPFKWKFWAYTQLVAIMKSIESSFVLKGIHTLKILTDNVYVRYEER